jgi:hypothetical protein
MKPPRRSGASMDSDEISEAIENLDLETIKRMKKTLTLDSDTLSEWLHALSGRIVEGCTAESDPDACVERFRPFYSALKGVAVNIGALDASLDLSPWHAFEARAGRAHVLRTRRQQSFEERIRTLSGLNTGVRVVLLALPLHRSLAPQDNAFMTENSAGETPLMHLLRNDYPPPIIEALCLRGGGFSTREWESGALFALLTDRGDIEPLVLTALRFFRADFLHLIHLHGREHGESVLQTYCRRCPEPSFADVCLLVEAVGEDPRGTAAILRGRAASLGSYEREELRQVAAYLETVQSPAA